MSDLVGLIFTAFLSVIGCIAVAYLDKKAEREKRRRQLAEYEARIQQIKAEVAAKTLPDLIRDSNKRLGERRGQDN